MAEPTKGDWASKWFLDLKELNITESLEEITKMSKTKFSNMVKSKIKLNALKYLKEKQKSKGSEICYIDIEMADYLLPENKMLTIDEKQQLFAVRNRMTEITSNFPKPGVKPTCLCGAEENMKHIFNCKMFNEESEEYENIFNGSLTQQIKIFNKFQNKMKTREIKMNEKQTNETNIPCDPSDPLIFVRVSFSNFFNTYYF
jgi:hypothetical protein